MADTTRTLIPLAEVEPALIEQVLDCAFGTDRLKRTAYLIREGCPWLPQLSFAALDEEGLLCGTIQAWPVALTDAQGRVHPLIMVGPVAVLPHLQGAGYGRMLMAAQSSSLESIGDEEGAAPLPQVLIGDEPYYGQFGFVEAPTGWQCPGPWDPARLLVRGASPEVLPQAGMLGPWRG